MRINERCLELQKNKNQNQKGSKIKVIILCLLEFVSLFSNAFLFTNS